MKMKFFQNDRSLTLKLRSLRCRLKTLLRKRRKLEKGWIVPIETSVSVKDTASSKQSAGICIYTISLHRGLRFHRQR